MIINRKCCLVYGLYGMYLEVYDGKSIVWYICWSFYIISLYIIFYMIELNYGWLVLIYYSNFYKLIFYFIIK